MIMAKGLDVTPAKGGSTNSLEGAFHFTNTSNMGELEQAFLTMLPTAQVGGTPFYSEPNVVINRIRVALEQMSADAVETLSDADRETRQDMLWQWYQLAAEVAIYAFHDRENANKFIEQAIMHDEKVNPHLETRLFEMLLRNDPSVDGYVGDIGIPAARKKAQERIATFKQIDWK